MILLDGERYGEDDLMAAIDAGAEDVASDGDVLKVLTAATDLAAVRSALEESGVEIASAELSMEPQSTVEVSESEAGPLLRLMDSLEEHDDVDSVHANFDVPGRSSRRPRRASGPAWDPVSPSCSRRSRAALPAP